MYSMENLKKRQVTIWLLKMNWINLKYTFTPLMILIFSWEFNFLKIPKTFRVLREECNKPFSKCKQPIGKNTPSRPLGHKKTQTSSLLILVSLLHYIFLTKKWDFDQKWARLSFFYANRAWSVQIISNSLPLDAKIVPIWRKTLVNQSFSLNEMPVSMTIHTC